MEITVLVEKGMYVLLGVLVTAITGHLLSKSREIEIHKIISFHTAADKFRHSFDDALMNIDIGEEPMQKLLWQFYMPHKISVLNFKNFLRGKTRLRFEAEWEEYEKYYKAHYKKNAPMAFAMSANTSDEIANRSEYRAHIEHLIQFATRQYSWHEFIPLLDAMPTEK
jgi:hypothetical protein